MISKAAYFKPAGPESWFNFLKDMQLEGTGGFFLMIAENTVFDYKMLRPLFKEFAVPIFGGIFPGVIYEDIHYSEGVVGCSIEQPIILDIIKSLDTFSGFSDEKVSSDDSVLLLVDRRNSNISFFLNSIFETSGSHRVIGGGAGSLNNQHKQVLFTQEEAIDQGAIIVRLKGPLGLGVNHGWEPMYGPLVVNNAQGNEIKEINWQKAFPYYQQILLEHQKVQVEQANFFDIAKSYPFGMVKMDGSIIVRDPIQAEGDSMMLIGEIPQNSIILLLQGNKSQLIDAAGNAVQQAFRRYHEFTEKRCGHVLLVDCISRALFLGKDFNKELRVIRENIPYSTPLFGFLSFGEIASNGDRYLEFYNKTTVVGVL